MSLPLVSVCIPVYNGAKHLETCLQSAIDQTYPAIEILLVDDGSTDDSVSIIERFAASDKRIRLIRNEQNMGLTGNWIKSIEQAKGEWIKLLFQDDLMRADCVETMYNACVTNNTLFCFCARDFLIENSASERLKVYFQKQVLRPENYFKSTPILQKEEIIKLAEKNLLINFLGEPIVTFFAKNIIQQTGTFKKGLTQLVDYEFMLRALLTVPSCFLPEKLVTFRVHGEAVSDSHFQNKEKLVKNELIEPLIIFHEYLFDPHFSSLKKRVGARKLFGNFFRKYRQIAVKYPAAFIKKNSSVETTFAEKLSLLIRLAEFSLLFKRKRADHIA
jgi:glycosyltransferase involved in cell wall biosynthesis